MYKHILRSLSEVSSLLSDQWLQLLRKGGVHVLDEVLFVSFCHLHFLALVGKIYNYIL